MNEKRYTVFEARNERRRELFIGATATPMFDVISRLRAAPPAAIRHWSPKDVMQVRSVEFHLTAEQAGAFVASFANRTFPPGWRVLSDCCPA